LTPYATLGNRPALVLALIGVLVALRRRTRPR